MPQRETIQRRKSQSFLNLGSINERVQGTELADNEWSTIVGTFPEFTGLQARLWGKRLLAKYDYPIMGIYQFWTPLGYAGGIYQFTGTVDFGKWLTPTTRINLTPLDTVGFDSRGYSLDDFGYEFGRSFTISTINACTFDFEEFKATHVFCGEEIKGANLPDDSNGGPAGQGRTCQWTAINNAHTINALIVSQQHGLGGDPGSQSPGSLIPPPFNPNPVPLPPVPSITYTPAAVPQTSPFATLQLDGAGVFAPPLQVFTSNYENYITILDLSSLASEFVGRQADLVLSISHQDTIVGPPVSASFIVDDIDLNDPDSYSAYSLNMLDYLPTGQVVVTGSPAGEHSYAHAVLTGISIVVRTKVCL